jgi:quercetin dioxygenase-like cupin family protein
LALILFSPFAHELAPVIDFQSQEAGAAELATGSGEAHIHVIHIAAGGEIGPHVAGFGQVFLCLEGSGWVAAADGEHVPIVRGQAAYFARGERHSKGSTDGLRALIIQVHDLHLCALTAERTLKLTND